MDNQQIIQELGLETVDLIESYKRKLPPYEIGHQLISNAVSMMLFCAHNELLGVKTILACVENGIASYEEKHS